MSFGVVTPTLDAERYFEATLRSIWEQQGDTVRVDHVVVDGGSTDRTLAIAAGYPSRVVVSEVGWVCGRVEYIDGEGHVLGRMTPTRLSLRSYLGLGWSCIPQQTVWARRSFFDEVGEFDLAYRNCGDYDWYARAIKLEHPHIMRETIGRFRLHPGQISLDPEKMRRESRMVQERHGRRDLAGAAMGRLLSLRLNAANPRWLVAKKTGRISFEPREGPDAP
ncbi:MAG: glycosyltransferase [Actinobacteria bacterium]|nr:glycosyltransferase [Actinomycetota bacterium]